MKGKLSKVDLTEGPIWKQLLLFFLPIAASTCMQQLYNAADALIVAKYVGTDALAAVGGSSSQIINFLIGFFVGITSGASVIISQLFGAEKYEDVRKAAGSSLVIWSIIGALVSGLGLLLSGPMLELLETPAETMEGANLYLSIYFTGAVFVFLLNMESNCLRAVGDSKSPFIFMAVSCVSNIIMDFIFVKYFNWGIAGVAIATVLAQVINTALLAWKLFTVNDVYKLSFSDLGLKWKYLKRMFAIGIPAGLQSTMYSVSNLIIQVGVNELGTIVVASWAMSGKTDGIYWAISEAIGASITTFVGQNFGAGKLDRVKGCVKQGFAMASAITLAICVLLLVFGIDLLNILTDDPAVVETTYQIMWYFVPFYIIWTVIEVMSGVLRGSGDAVRPVIIIGLGICLVRVIWVMFVCPFFGTLEVLSAGYIVSWFITAIGLATHYFMRMRKLTRSTGKTV